MFEVAIVDAPPVRLIPWEAVELFPPVPFNVIVPPVPVVFIEPAVREIPWQAPVVPVAVAVIAIVLLLPVAWNVELDANPTPASPLPVMEEVAVTVPAVVKAAATLIPLPPEVPPKQLEKITAPFPV